MFGGPSVFEIDKEDNEDESNGDSDSEIEEDDEQKIFEEDAQNSHSLYDQEDSFQN